MACLAIQAALRLKTAPETWKVSTDEDGLHVLNWSGQPVSFVARHDLETDEWRMGFCQTRPMQPWRHAYPTFASLIEAGGGEVTRQTSPAEDMAENAKYITSRGMTVGHVYSTEKTS